MSNVRSVLALTLFAATAACSLQEAARPVYPRPTENVLDEGAEERQSSLRKAWFEHRHQTAPGSNWRAIERANGEALIQERNRLASALSTVPSPWTERGSQNVAGRVHATALAPDGQSLYVGTSLGGTWEGSLDGGGWTPFGDNLYGGGHHLAVVDGATPADPDVVLVATDGGLVHVTRNQGLTWEVPPIGGVQLVRRVLTASDGSDTVFVLRRKAGKWELMRSTDAFASFQVVYDLGTFPGDAWMMRDGRNDLYVMTRTGVVASTNLGDTWTSMGPAPVNASQAELAGSEAGAPRLWNVSTVGTLDKLYRSDDAGATWTFLQDITDYWNVINASITSVDTFLWGGVEAHRTVNGGTSFSVINTWGSYYSNPAARLHADIQGIDVVANAGPFGETWYISTDGGLYRSTDLLASVQNLSLTGLRVSQYYSTHTSVRTPSHVVAGAQDQGYQRAAVGAVPPQTNLNFTQLISGDYGHLTSGDGDHDFLFSVYPGFVLCHVGENNPQLFTEDFPAGEDHAWMPPVVADPLDARHFFLCASRIYRYTKAANNNWTFALWSTHDFGIASGEYVSALVFSPIDPNYAHAVTDRGRLWRSTNRGVTWTQSTSNGPSGQYFYGTALLASATERDTVYVGGSGYAGPAVYRSVDGGVSYQPYSTGLPATLVYCLGESRDQLGTIFCGTETAAYSRNAGAASWTNITGTQAPITIYWSVEAVPGNVMRFGTYGRGIWDYNIAKRTKLKPGSL